MTAPTIKVEISFDGSTFVDVTQWCSGQITTNRGRSRETDQYAAGTLNFILRNEDRRFDPSNTSSPYYPNVVPRLMVKASIATVQVFGGYINDLTVDYEIPNICTVAVSCIDGFNILANTFLQSYSAVQQLSGARILAVLGSVDDVNYPGVVNIATGLATLQANMFTSTPASPVAALDHLQTVARSENGYLFIDRTGVLTFFDRDHVSTITSSVGFVDTGAGVRYQAISQKSQALLLYNQITGTRNENGGTTPVAQVADDMDSQAQYFIRALSLSSLENLTDGDVLDVCEYLVGRYSEPDVRFDTLAIELQSLTGTQLASVLALDLVKMVTVSRTPPGSGSPTTITKLSLVDGISFALDVSGSTYRMTIQLASVDTRSFFILDDPVFGLLDVDKLNY